MTEKTRTVIYEEIGRVKCSPLGIEYQSPDCEQVARFVCHHCKAPLCAKCAKKEPDEEFPIFSELESSSNVSFYAGLSIRILVPVLLFALSIIIRNLLGVPNLASSEIFYTDFQSIRITLPNFQMSMNLVALLGSLAILSATSMMFTTYVRSEADSSGRIRMKIYEKKNLSAVHCRHCWERYHENRSRIFELWIPVFLASISVMLLLFGLWWLVVDLTIPLITIALAVTVRKIAKRRMATRIIE